MRTDYYYSVMTSMVVLFCGLISAWSSFAADVPDGRLYDALSHAPKRASGNGVRLEIYRAPGKPVYGKFAYKAPAKGLVLVDPPHGTKTRWTDEFEIAWSLTPTPAEGFPMGGMEFQVVVLLTALFFLVMGNAGLSRTS